MVSHWNTVPVSGVGEDEVIQLNSDVFKIEGNHQRKNKEVRKNWIAIDSLISNLLYPGIEVLIRVRSVYWKIVQKNINFINLIWTGSKGSDPGNTEVRVCSINTVVFENWTERVSDSSVLKIIDITGVKEVDLKVFYQTPVLYIYVNIRLNANYFVLNKSSDKSISIPGSISIYF